MAEPRGKIRPDRFGRREAVLCVVFWAVALLAVSRVPAIETWGVNATIVTVVAALRLTGRNVIEADGMITIGRTNLEISPDCSPHLPILILAGAVIATRASWRDRALGVLGGAILLYAFNVARILALFGVRAWRPEWFEFAHVYLWQIGTIVAVLVAYAGWRAWIERAVGKTA